MRPKGISYKGKIIISTPYHLQDGRFSSNGVIQIHTLKETIEIKPPELQAEHFKSKSDADSFFIDNAKKLIDNGII